MHMEADRHDSPEATTATVYVLVVGSVDSSAGTVESTICLVRDGAATIVIDPGMVDDRRQILEPSRLSPSIRTTSPDIVFSHHHPDQRLIATPGHSPRDITTLGGNL